MKIDLKSIDLTQFYVKEHILNGEAVYLVFPRHIGAKWTKENKILRSSVWNSNGELISAGFPKFTNWGESPEVFPLPASLNGATVVEKIDGSLLIVSKYKGHFIFRTRGTIDASQLENGYELETFKQIILPKIEDFMVDKPTLPWSFLFEWTSPTQKIILNYGDEPQWYLVGIVHHDNYSIHTQHYLDLTAKQLGLKRPNTYSFSTIEDLLSNVDQWKDKEGVCVYSNDGQSIHKIKSSNYLVKHRFKSQATLENTIDLFFNLGNPSYQEFERILIEKFDYECFNMVRGFASKICDGWKEVQKIEEGMHNFVKNELSKYPTRKLQAVATFQSYGKKSNRSSLVFKILDGKPWDDNDYKKLIYQVTKDK